MFSVSKTLGISKPARVPIHDDESEETLLGHPEAKLGEPGDFKSILQNAVKSPLVQTLAASVLLNLVLGFIVLYRDVSTQTYFSGFDSSLDSSPVGHVISYEQVSFTLGDPDEYAPFIGHNATEVDQLWDELYGSSLYHISRSQLNNFVEGFSTFPGPADDHYIVGTYVFHQLHCINLLRKLIHPDMYPPDPDDFQRSPGHLDHCIEQLRQSVMCAGDVTPLAWHWDESINDAQLWATLPHMCRNFDRIQDFVFNDIKDLRRLNFSNEMYYDIEEN